MPPPSRQRVFAAQAAVPRRLFLAHGSARWYIASMAQRLYMVHGVDRESGKAMKPIVIEAVDESAASRRFHEMNSGEVAILKVQPHHERPVELPRP